jgi:hypothetical protein
VRAGDLPAIAAGAAAKTPRGASPLGTLLWTLPLPLQSALRREELVDDVGHRLRTLTAPRMEPVLSATPGLEQRRDGPRYRPTDRPCLETRRFPESPNEPAFPSTVFASGDTYDAATTSVA